MKQRTEVSRPTAFKMKYRWYLPRFIYQMVVNDITEIDINYAPKESIGGAE